MLFKQEKMDNQAVQAQNYSPIPSKPHLGKLKILSNFTEQSTFSSQVTTWAFFSTDILSVFNMSQFHHL